MTWKQSEALSAKIKRDYITKYGLRERRECFGCTCVVRRKNRIRGNHDGNCRGPHADHAALFQFGKPFGKTKEFVHTEQPYYGYEPATLDQIKRDVEAFAAAKGLTVRVSTDESWHCPGKTVLIEYRQIKAV